MLKPCENGIIVVYWEKKHEIKKELAISSAKQVTPVAVKMLHVYFSGAFDSIPHPGCETQPQK